MLKEIKLVDPYEHELHTYIWETTQPVKGIIQVIHGAGEHTKRYEHFALHFNKLGYHVIGNDHLGHGLTGSDLKSIYFDDTLGFHKVYEGVKRVRDYIEEQYPKLPVIMFAHSMGSFIGRYAIIHDHKRYDQAIFSGTGLFNPVSLFFAKIIANIIILFKGRHYISRFFNHRVLDGQIRAMKRNGLINDRFEWITQDTTIQKSVLNDPLIQREFTIGAQKDILKFLPEIQDKRKIKGSSSSTAIYFMSGNQDGLGHFGLDAKKLYMLYHECGYSNVKYTVLNNCRHEIIHELEKDIHYAKINSFINTYL